MWNKKNAPVAVIAALWAQSNDAENTYTVSAGVTPVAIVNNGMVACSEDAEDRVGTLYLLPNISGLQADHKLVLRDLAETAKDRTNQPRQGEEQATRGPSFNPNLWAIGTWVFVEWLRRGNSEYRTLNLSWGYVGLDEAAGGNAFRISPSTMATMLSGDTHKLVQSVMSSLWGFAQTAQLADGQLTIDLSENGKVIQALTLEVPGEIRVNREVRGATGTGPSRKKIVGGATPTVAETNQTTTTRTAEQRRAAMGI